MPYRDPNNYKGWVERNKERLREYRRQWDQKHPRRHNPFTHKLWRDRNKDRIRHYRRFNNRWRIRFKDKTVYLGFNPRSGRCSNCGMVGKTTMHHTAYNESDPLANTIELCHKCHFRETVRLRQCIRNANRSRWASPK